MKYSLHSIFAQYLHQLECQKLEYVETHGKNCESVTGWAIISWRRFSRTCCWLSKQSEEEKKVFQRKSHSSV